MKMKFAGLVDATTKQEPNQPEKKNALFRMGDHQMSVPCDSKLDKLCKDLKEDQEIEVEVTLKW